MANFLFVGERPSPTAIKMGVNWKDGRLAAKQLFDALEKIGINPNECRFDNVFKSELDKPEIVCKNAIRRIKRASDKGLTIVAMGQKATSALITRNVSCLSIVHPAARGKIRKKQRYTRHLKSILKGNHVFS